jgi:deoxyribonuclease V
MDKKRLISIQQALAKRVILKDEFNKELIAGADLAYRGRTALCGVVVLEFSSLKIVEKKVTEVDIRFPYIPTFLAFREAYPIIEALSDIDFDILMVDGHGIAHPRGMGIASHVGVEMNVPTIGVAKKLLCGEVLGEIKVRKPIPIIYQKNKVGYAFKPKKGVRPIYISPGHKISLDSALKLTISCIRDYKLPEPIRLAHLLANKKL